MGLLPVLQFQNGYSLPSATVLGEGGNVLLALAMAAMGLEVNLRVIASVGGAAMMVGTITAAVACAVSWALIRTLL